MEIHCSSFDVASKQLSITANSIPNDILLYVLLYYDYMSNFSIIISVEWIQITELFR